jgi:hypothetical protein
LLRPISVLARVTRSEFAPYIGKKYQADMDEGRRYPPFWAWLVGRQPRGITLVIAGASGVLFGLILLAANEAAWWASAILFLLAFDLAAGFVSNLSTSTRSFWSGQPLFLRATYVVLHLLAYPLAIWALVSSAILGAVLSAVLGAKIVAFVVGGFGSWPAGHSSTGIRNAR